MVWTDHIEYVLHTTDVGIHFVWMYIFILYKLKNRLSGECQSCHSTVPYPAVVGTDIAYQAKTTHPVGQGIHIFKAKMPGYSVFGRLVITQV